LHVIQRCQMLVEFAVDLYARQCHAATNLQHHRRRRLRRLPSPLARLEAFERDACLLQIAPYDAWHQHQHAQRDAQQVEQPDDPMCVLQKQWWQRQRATFQPPETLFDQIRAARRGDALCQGQRLGSVLGRLDTPAQALRGLGERRLITRHTYTYALAAHGCRWARAVSTFNVLVDFSHHGDVDQPLHAICGHERGHGLVGRRFVRQALLAWLAFIQGLDRGDGTCDALSSALLLARRKGQRAHDEMALLPRAGLPGLIQGAALDRVCKAARHGIGRLIPCTVGVWQADLAWLEHTTQARGTHAVESHFRHLRGGERAQGVILVGHDLRPRADGRHLAVPDVGQPGELGDLADFGNLRQIQRVIGRLTGHDRRRQRQAERITPRHGDLYLGQIGAMILAVAELEQPFGCHVGRRRRGIDVHLSCLPVIDAEHRLIAFACKLDPAFSDAQVVEHRRQPIIGQVARCDLSATAPTEGAVMGFDPRLDAIEPVVALGEEEVTHTTVVQPRGTPCQWP
jgi:hypothetical protein